MLPVTLPRYKKAHCVGFEPTLPNQESNLIPCAPRGMLHHSVDCLVAVEVFETSNPAYEAFIYPDSPRYITGCILVFTKRKVRIVAVSILKLAP